MNWKTKEASFVILSQNRLCSPKQTIQKGNSKQCSDFTNQNKWNFNVMFNSV